MLTLRQDTTVIKIYMGQSKGDLAYHKSCILEIITERCSRLGYPVTVDLEKLGLAFPVFGEDQPVYGEYRTDPMD